MVSSDSELVDLVASGHVRAYGELYRRHVRAALQQANRLTGHHDDSHDLVAGAFMKVLLAIQRGSRPHRFRAYLLTTVRRIAYNRTRRERLLHVVSLHGDDAGDGSLDVPAPDSDPAGRADRSDALEIVRQAFRSLPPRWRAALWLTVIEERTPGDLASMFDLAPNAMNALTYRARRGLRRAHVRINAHYRHPV
jgi:RNA polymerase sigma factor (sigma-70 family)